MRLSPRHWSPKSGAQSTGWARGTTRELLETGLRSAGGGRVQPRAGHEAGRAAFLCHSCIFHFLCQSPFKRAETLPHRTQRPCLLTQLPPCERSRQLLWHVRGTPSSPHPPPLPTHHVFCLRPCRSLLSRWLACSEQPPTLAVSVPQHLCAVLSPQMPCLCHSPNPTPSHVLRCQPPSHGERAAGELSLEEMAMAHPGGRQHTGQGLGAGGQGVGRERTRAQGSRDHGIYEQAEVEGSAGDPEQGQPGGGMRPASSQMAPPGSHPWPFWDGSGPLCAL